MCAKKATVLKNARMALDIAMVVLLPVLMAYSLIGEKFHEIVGTAMLVLFLAHHIFNRKWYGALFRGRYTARRIAQTALDFLLLLFMILQPLSGILMSKYLYTFLPALPVSASAREVHMLLAYWGFVLMSIHAGAHLTAPFAKLRKNRKGLWLVLLLMLIAVSGYGVYAFIQRGFPDYMTMKVMFAFFDYDEPLVCFFADYLAVMALFAFVGCIAFAGLGKLSSKRKA